MNHSSPIKNNFLIRTKIFHHENLVILLVFTAAFALYIANINSFQVGTYNDDAHYIVLAQSLATGQGFSRISYPVPQPEIYWPVGYPLALAPLVAIWPFNFEVLKLSSIILSLLSVFLVYKIFRNSVTKLTLVLLLALYALNPYIVSGASMVMSEPFFLVTSLSAIYLFIRFRENGFSKWYQILIIGFLISWATMIRLVGFCLAGAILFDLLTQKKIKQVILLGIVFGISLFPQLIFAQGSGNQLLPSGTTGFLVSSSDGLITIVRTLQDYIAEYLPNVLFGAFGATTYTLASNLGMGWLVTVAKYILLSLILVGMSTSPKKYSFLLGYLAIYFLVIGVKKTGVSGHASNAEPRYLIPLLPLLYYYFLSGLSWVIKKLSSAITNQTGKKYIKTIYPGLTGIILVLLFARGISSAFNPLSSQITDISIGTQWISENSPGDSIIMSRSPVARYLYSQRRTLDFPDSLSQEMEIFQFMEDNNVSYIFVAPKMQVSTTSQLDSYQTDIIMPLIQDNPDRFLKIFSNETHNVMIYQITHN